MIKRKKQLIIATFGGVIITILTYLGVEANGVVFGISLIAGILTMSYIDNVKK